MCKNLVFTNVYVISNIFIFFSKKEFEMNNKYRLVKQNMIHTYFESHAYLRK